MKTDCEGNTLSQHVMCPNTYICIKQDWLCGENFLRELRFFSQTKLEIQLLSDGDDDCNDFTDETHCGTKTNCSDDQFECLNGLCVPQEWICGKNETKARPLMIY